MFLTVNKRGGCTGLLCRNPLKSGQCFLHIVDTLKDLIKEIQEGRNPLKSGQCFLLGVETKGLYIEKSVAIPSNRVNVSYCLLKRKICYVEAVKSQSPQIGSMFLT